MAEQAFAEDPRTPIERLRRHRLWKIADAYEIPYPQGASKEVMIQLLTGHGVDVTRPLPNGERIPWVNVPVQTEDGRVVHQLYPEEQEAGGSNTGDVMRVVREREEQKKQEREEAADRELERENAALKDRLNEVLDAQERMSKQFETLLAQVNGNAEKAPESTQESRAEEPDQGAGDTQESSNTGEIQRDAADNSHEQPEHTAETESETGQTPPPAQPDTPETPTQMTGLKKAAYLRSRCKEAGIPIKKSDKIIDLERKLAEAEQAAGDDNSLDTPGNGDPF